MRLTPKTHQKFQITISIQNRCRLTYLQLTLSSPHAPLIPSFSPFFSHSAGIVWFRLASFLIPIKGKYMHINNVIKIKTRFGFDSISNWWRPARVTWLAHHLRAPKRDTSSWHWLVAVVHKLTTSSHFRVSLRISHARFQIICAHTHTRTDTHYSFDLPIPKQRWAQSVCVCLFMATLSLFMELKCSTCREATFLSSLLSSPC